MFEFSKTWIRKDGTIRPLSDKSKCLYHKMNGFTENEKIYMSDCFDHSRYRWVYNETSGMVMNENRHTTTPHCWTIPNVEVTEAKQQMYLSPCSIDRVDQRFDAVDGMARVRSNLNVCIMKCNSIYSGAINV